MAKKQGRRGPSAPNPGSLGATLREEKTGIKHVPMSSKLRMQHLQKLATWAGGEASIPPLGALFGHRLATNAEVLGVPLDNTTLPCQRCETILQAGYNCTIRVEKIGTKAKHRKESCIPMQNNVVYTCHFCSHRNLKMGTPKGHMKQLFTSRPRLAMEPEPQSCTNKRSDNSMEGIGANEKTHNHKNVQESFTSPMKYMTTTDTSIKADHMTPSEKIGAIILEKKSKMNGSLSRSGATSGPNSVLIDSGKGESGSSKRKRKGWSSLKEISEHKERESKLSISNLAIPFIM